ncbi:LLM class flavin-dependent oxidoreductase [Mesorhizobium sp. B2-1-3A]|uniref:LLM class flavin-dependent oxidoreductase n=1 Tax=Mesorhizobium sp. B2-1-3A TaxID=2589971 RepID=UPI00112D841D|nr:LLM class flavin-dependent oxidoreductase [Mesorhizobium sp. B2-1-3A]TPM94748.1 LLM class flavin-dependent oxidoreductase [Mesorhizobium sp. B2-1-3A]
MSAIPRFLRLNAVVYGLGNHEAAWRMPESDPFATTSLAHWVRLAQLAEAAGFESLFLGDVLALLQGAEKHLSDTMDPLVILSALAAVTSRIGLIGTLSTSFEPAFHIARRFASLDHITGGRAGWNIVTSSNRLEASNFGTDRLPDHAERYAKARDVVDAAMALWDSWDADARIGDKQAGLYFDPAKVRAVNHSGPFVRTAGPLNTPRSPQGRPLLVQAGSSEDGRDLAASRADLVFTAQLSLDDARAFYRDIKTRAERAGRDPDTVLVMPGIMPVVAETRAAAQARLDAIDGVIVREHALEQLSEYLQTDARSFDLDAPLPASVGDEGRSQANKSRFALIVTLARREGLTVRQLLQRVGGGRGHFLQAGTAAEIADTMQEWFETGAADGFSVMCPVLPADLETFSAGVVPELGRRGLLGTYAPGSTLRQRIGLPSEFDRRGHRDAHEAKGTG